MAEPLFRLVCRPGALVDASTEWVGELLAEGEIALIPDPEAPTAIDGLAHRLGLVSVTVLRGEAEPARQAATVIAFAGALPIIWVAAAFAPTTVGWARERGAMTLLVDAAGALEAEQRARIARFAAALGRQSE